MIRAPWYAGLVVAGAVLAGCGEGAPASAGQGARPSTGTALQASAAAPVDVLAAVAERESLEAPVRLSWTTEPAAAPVDVLVASEPMLPVEDMALLASGVVDGALDTEPGVHGFFALRFEDGSVHRFGERVLPLAGGRNFRDIGGYVTESGQQVRWGTVFRSGTMHALTEGDYRYLDALDVRTLVDFRADEERSAEPTDWSVDAPEYFARSYSNAQDFGALGAALSRPGASTESVRAMMQASYAGIARQQAEAYAVMFDRLAAGEVPLVFNCSAGKDRTGVAAALLLTALGVPRDEVVADYAMSDKIVDYSAAFELDAEPDEESPWAMMRALPRELTLPLMESNPMYIESALDTIEANYGSVAAFLEAEVDVTPAELAAIRARLLVPAEV